MNKIFKVVWSKVRGCWVVASEFAKNHTKASVRRSARVGTYSLASVLAVTALVGVVPDVAAATGDRVATNPSVTARTGVADTPTGSDLVISTVMWTDYERDSAGNIIYYDEYGRQVPKGQGVPQVIVFNSPGFTNPYRASGLPEKGETWYENAIMANYYNPGNMKPVEGVPADTRDYSLAAGGVAVGKNTRLATDPVDVYREDRDGNKIYYKAIYQTGVAVGDYAQVKGTFGTALGTYAQAVGPSSTAIGPGAQANGSNALAMMRQSAANGDYSTAIGTVSYAKGKASIALGFSTTAIGDQSIAIGVAAPPEKSTIDGVPASAYNADDNTVAEGYRSFALGARAYTGDKADNALAIGSDTNATGSRSAAIGGLSAATGNRSLSFGFGSEVTNDDGSKELKLSTVAADNAIGIGNDLNITGESGMAMGNNTLVTGMEGVTIGSRSQATGKQAVNLGVGGTASGDQSMNLGSGGTASGQYAVNLGLGGEASGAKSMNLGDIGRADGESSVNIGLGGQATAKQSLNFGVAGTSSAENSINVGTLGRATGQNALNFGTGGAALANNSISIGHNGRVTALGENSTSIGNESRIDAIESVSLGNNNAIQKNRQVPMYVLSDKDLNTSLALAERYVKEQTAAKEQAETALQTLDPQKDKENYDETVAARDKAQAEIDRYQPQIDSAKVDIPRFTELRNKLYADGTYNESKLSSDELKEYWTLGTKYYDVPLHDVVSVGNNIKDTMLNSVFLGNNSAYTPYRPEWRSMSEPVYMNGELIPSKPNVPVDPTKPSTYVSAIVPDVANTTRGIDTTYGQDAFYNYRKTDATGKAAVTNVMGNFAGGSTVVGAVSVGGTKTGKTIKETVRTINPETGELVEKEVEVPIVETRRIQNVAPGLLSPTSTDAVNGSQLFALGNVVGNLTGSIADALGGEAVVNPDGSISLDPHEGEEGIYDGIAGTGRHNAQELLNMLVTDVRGDRTYTPDSIDTPDEKTSTNIKNGAAEVRWRNLDNGRIVYEVHVDKYMQAQAKDPADGNVVLGDDNYYYKESDLANKVFLMDPSGTSNGAWYDRATVTENKRQLDGKWYNKAATEGMSYLGGKWYSPDTIKDYLFYDGHWYDRADVVNGKPTNTADVIDDKVTALAKDIQAVDVQPTAEAPTKAVLENRLVNPNDDKGTQATRLVGVDSVFGNATTGKNGAPNNTTVGDLGTGDNTFIQKLATVGEDGGIDKTYAATVGDLKNLADTPLFFSGDVAATDATNGKNTFARKLSEETKIIGGQADVGKLSDGKNIGVVSNGKDTLTVKLAKELSGITSIGGNEGKGKISFNDTDKNISVNDGQITDVASGFGDRSYDQIKKDRDAAKADTTGQTTKPTELTNAVNVGDLMDAADKIKDGTGEGATGGFALAGNTTKEGKPVEVHQDLGKAITVKGGLAETDKRVTKAGGIDKAVTDKNTYVTVDAENKALVVNMAKDLKDLDSATFTKPEDKASGTPASNTTVSGDGVTTDGTIAVNGKDGENGVDGKNAVELKDVDGAGHIVLNGKDGKTGATGADGAPAADMTVVQGKPSLDPEKNTGVKEDNTPYMDRIQYVDSANKTHEVATMDDGLKFGANEPANGDTNPTAVTLGGTVNILGGAKATSGTDRTYTADTAFSGKNVKTVIEDNGTIAIQMADKPEFDKVTVKGAADTPKTEINNNGVTITPSGKDAKPVSLTDTGLNNGGNQITNVKSGLDDGKGGKKPAVTDLKNDSPLLTNAANIGDLRDTANSLIDKGIKLNTAGQTGGAATVKLGDTINVANGLNTQVSAVTSSDNGTHTFHIDVVGIPATYVDAQGKKLTNVGGKYYAANEVNADGTLQDGAKEVTPKNVALINSDGTTTTTGGYTATATTTNPAGTQLKNVGSGLQGKSLQSIEGQDLLNAVNVGDLKDVMSRVISGNATRPYEQVVEATGAATINDNYGLADVYTVHVDETMKVAGTVTKDGKPADVVRAGDHKFYLAEEVQGKKYYKGQWYNAADIDDKVAQIAVDGTSQWYENTGDLVVAKENANSDVLKVYHKADVVNGVALPTAKAVEPLAEQPIPVEAPKTDVSKALRLNVVNPNTADKDARNGDETTPIAVGNIASSIVDADGKELGIGNGATKDTKVDEQGGTNAFIDTLRGLDATKDADKATLHSAATVGDLKNVADTPVFFEGDVAEKDDVTNTFGRKLGEKTQIIGGVTADGATDAEKAKAIRDKLTDGNIGVVSNGSDTLEIKLAKELSGITSAEFTNGKDGQDGKTTTVSGDGVTTDGTIAVNGKDGKDGENSVDGKNAVELKDVDGAGHIVLNGKDGKTGATGADGAPAADMTVVQGKPSLDPKQNTGVKEDNTPYMDRIQYVDSNNKTHQVATMDDGLKFGANEPANGDTNPTAVTLGGTVNILGGAKAESGTDRTYTGNTNFSGKNVKTVIEDNGTIAIQMADKPEFDKVTVKGAADTPKTEINNNGVTITPSTGNPVSLTNTGLNNGGNQITNVKSGLDDGKGGEKPAITDLQDGDTRLTNAANIGDLRDTAKDLIDKGIKLNTAGQTGDAATVKLGDTINVANGLNTQVSAVTSDKGTHTFHIDVVGIPATYVTNDGTPVTNIGGHFYTADQLDNGVPKDVGSNSDAKVRDIGLVSPTGRTDGSKPVLKNVGSGFDGRTFGDIKKDRNDAKADTTGKTPNPKELTNAVNVGDLMDAIDTVNSNTTTALDKALTFTGDVAATENGKKSFDRKLGEETKIIGGVTATADVKPDATEEEKAQAQAKAIRDKLTDGNIGVVSNGSDTLEIKLAKELSGITSAEFTNGKDGQDGKTTTVSGDGVTTDGTIAVNGKDGKDGKNAVELNRGADGAGHIVLNGKDGQKGEKGEKGEFIPAEGEDATVTPKADMNVVQGDAGLRNNTGVKDDGSGKAVDYMDRIQYVDSNNKTHQVATMDDGLKFAGNVGKAIDRTLGSQLNVKGDMKAEDKETEEEYTKRLSDGNIGVISDGTDTLTVKLAKDLTGLNSATFTKPENKEAGTPASTTKVDGNGVTITPSTGDTTKEVSLTNTGLNNGGNQITNVASGFGEGKTLADIEKAKADATKNNTPAPKELTNAVNVGDLVNAADQIKNDITKGTGEGATGGFALAGNTTENGKQVEVHQDLGKAITVKGGLAETDERVTKAGGIKNAVTDKNTYVTVDAKNTALVVNMAKDLTDLNSVTTTAKDKDGNTTTTKMDGNGITITPSGKDAKPVSLTDKGLDNGGNKITNVARGEANTDAVNVEQLNKAVEKAAAGAKTHLKEGTNTTLSGTGTEKDPYIVDVKDNLNLGAKDGKDGKDGVDGSVAVNGKDGSAVVINGKDGSIGLNGKDGANGISIKSGNGPETLDSGEDINRIVYTDTKNPANPPKEYKVATMDDGLKFGGNVGTTIDRKLGTQLNVKGDMMAKDGETAEAYKKRLSNGNIGVIADSTTNTLEVKLARDLKDLDSVSVGTNGNDGKNGTVISGGQIVVNGKNGKDGIVIDKDSDDVGSIKDGDKHLVTGNAVYDYVKNHGDANSVKYDDPSHTSVTLGGADAKEPVTLTNVKDGRVAPGSTDAVNGSQLFQTNANVNKLSQRINRVGAGAAALAALHPLDFDPDDKWDITAGYGNYNGANAVALGAFYRPNEDTMFSIGTSMGGGENMINAGVTLKLGQGNNVSTSRVAMAKELRDMRELLAKQAAEIAQLKQMHNLNFDDQLSELFPDVAENHWAYEYVTKIAGNGIVEGYPDGLFKGDRMMTRYEFAAIVYRMMQLGKGASDEEMSRLVKEFGPELKYIRVDTVHKDEDGNPTVQRVRVTEYGRTHA